MSLLTLHPSLRANDRARSAGHAEIRPLLLPQCFSFPFITSEAEDLTPDFKFIPPPLSLLFSSPRLFSDLNQLAVNNLLNSIDRHHLVSWPAT